MNIKILFWCLNHILYLTETTFWSQTEQTSCFVIQSNPKISQENKKDNLKYILSNSNFLLYDHIQINFYGSTQMLIHSHVGYHGSTPKP